MRGLVLDGVRRIRYRDDLDDPTVRAPTDAVVRVLRSGLCGSDLHPFDGREAVRFGVVPGHEVVGEVVAVGDAVTEVATGDRVIVPFTVSCGRCAPCRSGLTARCKHAGVYGFTPPATPDASVLDGGQAEMMRVPWADGSLVAVPSGMSDGDAVLLTDVFPTGWCAVERAGVVAGSTVVVVGLGAVGLCAVAAAFAQDAAEVVGVDPVGDRRDRAAALGATVAEPHDTAVVAGAADAAIDAAGTVTAQHLAFGAVRPGGTLSVIAVQTADRFGFSPVDAYDRNITARFGRAPVRAVLDRVLPRLADGSVTLPTALVVTHPTVPLADGPALYQRFAAREPGLVKALFLP